MSQMLWNRPNPSTQVSGALSVPLLPAPYQVLDSSGLERIPKAGVGEVGPNKHAWLIQCLTVSV